jgi:hypothetical protein
MEHLFYSIQQKEGKGHSAFELVQKMRNHASNVTKEYIRITSEGKMVSKHLFDRGEFGYIYDQLIDVLTEDNERKPDSLEERTTSIKSLSKAMNPIEVEGAVGFLDVMESEKSSVVQTIRKLDESEAFEFVRKIYLNQMPSKIKNVQCFSYPTCHRPSCEYSCFSCPFSIPNSYSLIALQKDLSSRIAKLRGSSSTGSTKKERKMLMHGLDLLSQAINEFGEDFVWTFFDGGQQQLEMELQQLDQG